MAETVTFLGERKVGGNPVQFEFKAPSDASPEVLQKYAEAAAKNIERAEAEGFTADKLKRYAGIAARAVAPTLAAMGTGATVGGLIGLGGGGITAIPGAVLGGVALPVAEVGMAGLRAAGVNAPSPTEKLQQALTSLGVPEAVTPGERRAQRYGEALVGAVAPGGAMKAVKDAPKWLTILSDIAGRPGVEAGATAAGAAAEEATGLLGEDVREKYGPWVGAGTAAVTGAFPRPASVARVAKEIGDPDVYVRNLGAQADNAFASLRNSGVGIVDTAGTSSELSRVLKDYKGDKSVEDLYAAVESLKNEISARAGAPGLGGHEINEFLNKKNNLQKIVVSIPEELRNPAYTLVGDVNKVLNKIVDQSLGTEQYKEARDLWATYKKAELVADAARIANSAKNKEQAWAKAINEIKGGPSGRSFTNEELDMLGRAAKEGNLSKLAGMISGGGLPAAGLAIATQNPFSLLFPAAVNLTKGALKSLADEEGKRISALGSLTGKYAMSPGLARALRTGRAAVTYAAPTTRGLLTEEE